MGIIDCHFRETYPAIKRDKRTILTLWGIKSSFRKMLYFRAKWLIFKSILLFIEEEVVLLWVVRPKVFD